MRERLVERRLPHTKGLCGNRDAPTIERPHGDPKPLARATEHRLAVDLHTIEVDVHTPKASHAERIGRRGGLQTWRIHRNEEGTHSPPTDARLGRGEHDHQIGRLCVGHPDLATAEPIAPLILARARLLVRRIGPGVLFRQRKRPQRGARGERP